VPYKQTVPKVATSSTHILVLVLGNSKSILGADTMTMTLICKNSVRTSQSPMCQAYQSFDLRQTVCPTFRTTESGNSSAEEFMVDNIAKDISSSVEHFISGYQHLRNTML
jgi:hypothetical protein